MAIRTALLLSLLLSATLASAQSHYGPYVGGYLASGSGDASWGVAGGATVRHSVDGGLGGVQGGFNWHRGSFLLGAQADLGFGRVSGSSRCPNPTFECETELLSLITVRGRAGPVFRRVALYGTAGIATGNVRTSIDNHSGTHDSQTQTHIGWVAGAGVSILPLRHIQVQAEFLRVGFSTEEHVMQNVKNQVKLTTDLVRVGVHYRFF